MEGEYDRGSEYDPGFIPEGEHIPGSDYDPGFVPEGELYSEDDEIEMSPEYTGQTGTDIGDNEIEMPPSTSDGQAPILETSKSRCLPRMLGMLAPTPQPTKTTSRCSPRMLGGPAPTLITRSCQRLV